MAISLKKQAEAARAKLDKASETIYAAAYPRRDIVFSECRKLASEAANAIYDASVDKLCGIEWDACNTGKAYRASGNMIVWNK